MPVILLSYFFGFGFCVIYSLSENGVEKMRGEKGGDEYMVEKRKDGLERRVTVCGKEVKATDFSLLPGKLPWHGSCHSLYPVATPLLGEA